MSRDQRAGRPKVTQRSDNVKEKRKRKKKQKQSWKREWYDLVSQTI